MTDDHIDIRITEEQLAYDREMHYPKDTNKSPEEFIKDVFNATIVDNAQGQNG